MTQNDSFLIHKCKYCNYQTNNNGGVIGATVPVRRAAPWSQLAHGPWSWIPTQGAGPADDAGWASGTSRRWTAVARALGTCTMCKETHII